MACSTTFLHFLVQLFFLAEQFLLAPRQTPNLEGQDLFSVFSPRRVASMAKDSV